MRVLHLFANYKWTGPAEPALNLCLALRARGIEADFACAPDAGASINKVVETARDRGLEPILDFRLSKHHHPIKNALDVYALGRFLRDGRYDLLHCHLDNDHRIALRPARKLGIPIVRSSYEGEGFRKPRQQARLVAAAAHLIEPSRMALEYDAAAYGLPGDRLTVVPGAVDTERFDPAREVPDGRRRLGIPPDAFVVGIVARMQTHRRYEDFWAAARRLAEAYPQTRIVVVGRGTNQERVGTAPVREMGLEGHVHFPGYLDGENYVGMLKSFNVKVLMVPGSDGTCRAVREAMAMARPVVVADRGMLREVVQDGETGYVCDGSPGALFECLARLAGDRALTVQLGRQARARALARHSLPVQAEAVEGVYRRVLGPS